jgi:hypothetical protein
MTFMVPLMLVGWIPVVLAMFATLPARRAMLISFLAAWMFLPNATYKITGVPEYSKMSATCLGVVLATLLFDARRWSEVRPSWLDIPMLVWCLCPFASSISNGLGAYDGLSAVVEAVVMWGLPYWFGRMYLRDLDGLRELAICLFIGGLVYVPFCLWEIRMSPNLHHAIYGFGGTGIEYEADLGKWGSRPRVFMGTALTVGLFMTAASISGIWLWMTRSVRQLWGCSTGALAAVVTATGVVCKNMGATALLALGMTALLVVKHFRSPTLLYALIAAAPLYMAARSAGRWSGEVLVNAAAMIHPKRAESLEFRLYNEDMLVDKAMEQPVWGWGRWGRARVYREDGKDISVTDGLWIIALGNTGLVGLTASTAVLLLPVMVFLRRYPVRIWLHPAVAPAGALAVLLVLYCIDNLFNAMVNPIYSVAAGGLVGLLAAGRAGARARVYCVSAARQVSGGEPPVGKPTARVSMPGSARAFV